MPLIPGVDPRPLPPPHTAHFTVLGTFDGAPWANTFWMRNGNAVTPSQDDFTQVVASFNFEFDHYILQELVQDVAVAEVSALYYEAGGAQMQGAVASTFKGHKNEASFPANVACCVGWRVQQHYKGGHPRTYLVGPPRSAQASSRTFDPAYVQDVAIRANEFNLSVNSISSGAWQGGKLGIVSFVFRKAWREPPVFRDFVTGSAHCDPRIDSMRRRLGRDVPP